jgi:hypothetical protein
MLTPPERRARRRRRRQEDIVRWILRAALILIVFGLGIALGQALHDNPKPGGMISFERTLTFPGGPPGSTITP